MSVEVVLDSPLAHALNSAIQPKLVEVGWSTGADGSDLSEYIILMLANGKTQEQIAAELSGDLLNLGDDDPGARDFSRWLFHQVDALNAQQNGGNAGFTDVGTTQADTSNGEQDADMGDVSEAVDDNVYVNLSPDLNLLPRPLQLTKRRPTGPKSMRNGATRPRDKRMLGHLAKAMDRTNDSVLHRVRPQNGNERINTHSRGAPPTGPRGQQILGRGGPRTMNARMNGPMGGMPMQQGAAAANIMNMTPQQQLELYAMLEQQSRLMAQMLNPQQQIPMGNGPANGFHQQQSGRSLFDRVQRPQQNGFRKGQQTGKFGDQHHNHNETPSSSMDVEMSQEKKEIDPETTTCKFNLTCKNADCKFAHQSPAAPPGATIDFGDTCSFGAACKNRKCTGRHPSPAQKHDFQAEQECKFYPNCTNPRCPFKHPSMPACHNGADCTTPNCKFSHSKVMCKYNPCLNATCIFKHVEGQKRGKFEDKVWTAESAKEHVSERKFVDENAPEELIVPGASGAGMSQASTATAELVT
jgi:nuclear polyadenylated RNA-binding protein NAB2